MFLNTLLKRNTMFVEAAVELHRSGQIPANSYVLDLDAVEANAALIAAEGRRLGVKVFPMTKQIGRNPKALEAFARQGLDACVAVNMACALPIRAYGHKIGHLGHLVQIPQAETQVAASLEPLYWTVFNDEKAQAASDACGKLNRKQALLARIHAPGDTFYTGHEGGFKAEEIVEVAKRLDRLSHAHFAGITTFPALLFDHKTQDVKPTPNMKTLENAASVLAAAGRREVEVNAPGTTSSTVMGILASAGATQVEPGHGLTGTTPLHAVKDLPELPAILYLTEVSHLYNGLPYCFGGGLRIDCVFPEYTVKALVGPDARSAIAHPMPIKFPEPASIDYYGIIQPAQDEKVNVGDSVVFSFRVQAFVAQAFVVPISGVSKGQPAVEGVYTADSRKTNWPEW